MKTKLAAYLTRSEEDERRVVDPLSHQHKITVQLSQEVMGTPVTNISAKITAITIPHDADLNQAKEKIETLTGKKGECKTIFSKAGVTTYIDNTPKVKTKKIPGHRSRSGQHGYINNF